MIKYELIGSTETVPSSVKAIDENNVISFIPVDASNSDYQAYLKSLDEASTL